MHLNWLRVCVGLSIASFASVALMMVSSVVLDGALGVDFGVFSVGGELAGDGRWLDLYDGDTFSALFHERLFPALAEDGTLNTFISTPTFALAMRPLALLPFGWSLAIWSAATIGVVMAAIRQLRVPSRWALGVLASPALIVDLAIGQSAMIMLGLSVLVHTSIRSGQSAHAGLSLGVLFALKPPLAVGYGVWWLVTGRESRSRIGWAVIGTAFAVAPTVVFGTAPWRAFIDAMRERVAIESSWQLNGVSLPEALKLLAPLAPTWFTLVSWAFSLVVGAVLVAIAHRRWGGDVELMSAVAVAITVLVSPHLAVYDTALLVIPLAVLWNRGLSVERLAMLVAIHGTTLAFGGILFDLQYEVIGRGLSVEFLGYAVSLVLATRWLSTPAARLTSAGGAKNIDPGEEPMAAAA